MASLRWPASLPAPALRAVFRPRGGGCRHTACLASLHWAGAVPAPVLYASELSGSPFIGCRHRRRCARTAHASGGDGGGGGDGDDDDSIYRRHALLAKTLDVSHPALMLLAACEPALLQFEAATLAATLSALADALGVDVFHASQLAAADPRVLLRPSLAISSARSLAALLGRRDVSTTVRRCPTVLALDGEAQAAALARLAEALCADRATATAAVAAQPQLLVLAPSVLSKRLGDLVAALHLEGRRHELAAAIVALPALVDVADGALIARRVGFLRLLLALPSAAEAAGVLTRCPQLLLLRESSLASSLASMDDALQRGCPPWLRIPPGRGAVLVAATPALLAAGGTAAMAARFGMLSSAAEARPSWRQELCRLCGDDSAANDGGDSHAAASSELLGRMLLAPLDGFARLRYLASASAESVAAASRMSLTHVVLHTNNADFRRAFPAFEAFVRR